MQYPRPHTEIHHLEDHRWQGFEGFVLKREGSDGTRHVILPGDGNSSNLPRVQDGFRWLKQSYVPTLRELGEWRVVMMDCRPLWVIHTAPSKQDQQQWTFIHRDAGISLEAMR